MGNVTPIFRGLNKSQILYNDLNTDENSTSILQSPSLSSLKTNGGTLYAFSSASKDLSRTFSNSSYDFKFSHFACLNLPDIYSGKIDITSDFTKGLYLDNLKKNDGNWQGIDLNKLIAEHFQNYIMNFETCILNGIGDNDDYNNTILRSPAERIFFNWLQKVGGIKFDGNTESYKDSLDRTVQYIGNIDVINNVDINGESFNEIYLYIPSTDGATPTIQFNQISDDNYIANNDYNCGKNEFIIGKDSNYVHPFDLSIDAIYDMDDGINKYTSDNGYCINFDIDNDGDVDDVDAKKIIENNDKGSNNFEFNTVLVYYDIIDKVSGEKATNLYGVLFLEEATDITNNDASGDIVKQGYIQRYPKLKATNGINGNSFALKLNIKIDTMPDYGSHTDRLVDPNAAASMVLYQQALARLQKCADIFALQQKEIADLQNRVNYLENQLYTHDKIEVVEKKLYEIENRMDSSDIVIDGKGLKSLISENSEKLNSLISGKMTTKLQYNTDVIKGGDGISIVRNNDDIEIKSLGTSAKNCCIPLSKENVSLVNSTIEIGNDNLIRVNIKPNKDNLLYIDKFTCIDKGNVTFNLSEKFSNGYIFEIIFSKPLSFNTNVESNSRLFITDEHNSNIIEQVIKLTSLNGANSIKIYNINDDFIYKIIK